MKIKKTKNNLDYHKDWNNQEGLKCKRWHAMVMWPGNCTPSSVLQIMKWKSKQSHQWNEMSISGIMSKTIYFSNNCCCFKILKFSTFRCIVKKILSLYYLYSILFLDIIPVPVFLAVLQEYINVLTSFHFYFLKVIIVSIIVLWLVNICQFPKTRSLLCYTFISEDAMLNQLCITLIYPMSIDTISLQVNFMLDKTLHAYRGCNIGVKDC